MDPLSGIAAEVDPRRVRALLVNREPDLLNPEAADHDLFLETVAGITAEVRPLIGQDPPPGPLRDLAVWCITLGVAASLEGGLYPEQQLGEDARASELRVRYLSVRADLRSRAGTGTTPRGKFPPAPSWPDPVRGW